jgi:hypothetical protein
MSLIKSYFFTFLFSIPLLSGCVSSPYQATVDDYVVAYQNISLGMLKHEVVSILTPSQKRISSSELKQPDMYKKGETNVDILYFRSGWNSDGLTTDDEFTPYVFNDGKLVAVGWQSLGGAKSQGQARDVHSTIVNTPAPIIIY